MRGMAPLGMKKKSAKTTFASRLKAARVKAGLSAGELALAIGSSTGRQIIHQWESGRTDPSSRWIMPLCRALCVTPEFLLDG